LRIEDKGIYTESKASLFWSVTIPMILAAVVRLKSIFLVVSPAATETGVASF